MFDINFTSYLYIFKKIRWCRQIAELGDLCSPNIADVGPAFISTTVRYSYRYRADIVPISGRRRPDGFLLSGLLNDFESKKENLSFENYIYDQEYFDTFTKYDQKHIAIYLKNLLCFN